MSLAETGRLNCIGSSRHPRLRDGLTYALACGERLLARDSKNARTQAPLGQDPRQRPCVDRSVLGSGVDERGVQVCVSLVEESEEVGEIARRGSPEKGGDLVCCDLALIVDADVANQLFFDEQLRSAIDDEIDDGRFGAASHNEPSNSGASCTASTAATTTAQTLDSQLHGFSRRAEQIEVIGEAMAEVIAGQRCASGQEERRCPL
jgi:hypothetical protein